MRMIQWLTAFCLMLAPLGCLHDVDRAIVDTRQAYHSVVRFHAEGLQAAQEALFDKLATENARLERAALEARQDAFLERHTDDKGGLVSKNAAGEIVPMPREQLLAFLAERDKQRAEADERAALAKSVSLEFRNARVRLVALTTKLAAKEIEWQEAKESAQAELDRIINVAGGLMAGAGAAIVVAP